MEPRQMMALFMGVMVAVLSWLLWLFVISGILGLLFGDNDPRQTWGPALSMAAFILGTILILALPAILTARMGARVATRMTARIEMWRVTFVLSLAMQGGLILIVTITALLGIGGAA